MKPIASTQPAIAVSNRPRANLQRSRNESSHQSTDSRCFIIATPVQHCHGALFRGDRWNSGAGHRALDYMYRIPIGRRTVQCFGTGRYGPAHLGGRALLAKFTERSAGELIMSTRRRNAIGALCRDQRRLVYRSRRSLVELNLPSSVAPLITYRT